MRLRIKRVIDWRTLLGSPGSIRVDDWFAAAISQNQIEVRNLLAKWIIRIMADPIECCRRIHIPKNRLHPLGAHANNFGLEQRVEHADAACLDDYICALGVIQASHRRVLVGRINDDSRPVRILDVPMLLPLVGVWLVKRYPMAALVESPN